MSMLKPRSGMRLTVDEFFALPEPWDKRKMELDEGVLYIMPRPRKGHGFLQFRLGRHFDDYIDGFEVAPAELLFDFTVALSLERRVLLVPDLSIVLRGSVVGSGQQMVEGPPDIVVEIISTDRNRDLVRKRRLYAAGGVPEYWIFDPRSDTATLLELRDGEYVERAVLTHDDTLTTPLLPGLVIPLGDVFRHRRRPAEEGDN